MADVKNNNFIVILFIQVCAKLKEACISLLLKTVKEAIFIKRRKESYVMSCQRQAFYCHVIHVCVCQIGRGFYFSAFLNKT